LSRCRARADFAAAAFGIEAPSVSWLGGICGAAFPFCRQLSRIESQRTEQWPAPEKSRLTVARRRRLFTVFPCTESRVEWSSAAGRRVQPARRAAETSLPTKT